MPNRLGFIFVGMVGMVFILVTGLVDLIDRGLCWLAGVD